MGINVEEEKGKELEPIVEQLTGKKAKEMT